MTVSSPAQKLTSSPGVWQRLQQRAFAPVDALPIAWFRIAYGATLLYWAWKYCADDRVKHFYVVPRFHFPYYGFDWAQVLSEAGMTRLFIAIQILGALVVLGVLYRVSSLLLGLAFCYVFLMDKAYYQNHYYLLSLTGLVLPLLPCHRTMSADALAIKSIRSQVVPAWSLFVVRFLVGVPYFYGGIAKINSDWLAGQPMRMVLSRREWHPVIGPWVTEDWMVTLFVWGGMLFDLLIVPALLWRRTRLLAFVCALVFHLMNATVFEIGVFPWFMIAATLVFLPAASFRRLFLLPSKSSAGYQRPSPRVQRAILGVLTVFVAFHLLWPLRHHVLPGNVTWTEHGHYFSWRMKLRGKTSALRFEAFDPKTRALESVNPQRWLTSFQTNRMARDPKMVHEFARFLKQQYADQGYPNTQIRVLSLVSLNGRKPQLMIDPLVDLGSLPRQWGEPTFVLPLTEPLRHDAWDEPRTTWARHLPAEYRKN